MSEAENIRFMEAPEVLAALTTLLGAIYAAVEGNGGKVKHFAIGVHSTIGQAAATGGPCACEGCKIALAKVIGAQLGFATIAFSASDLPQTAAPGAVH